MVVYKTYEVLDKKDWFARRLWRNMDTIGKFHIDNDWIDFYHIDSTTVGVVTTIVDGPKKEYKYSKVKIYGETRQKVQQTKSKLEEISGYKLKEIK